jgi:hypothetical protein
MDQVSGLLDTPSPVDHEEYEDISNPVPSFKNFHCLFLLDQPHLLIKTQKQGQALLGNV